MANQTLFLRTWDAGARTVAEFAGDGAFTFQVGPAIGVVVGLNTVNRGVNYTEIEHGFFVEAGLSASVIERGVRMAERVAIQPGATFRIERVAGVVTYSIDGVAHYTSARASFGTVFLDCSLWQYGDAVIDATYVAVDHADGRATLPALAAFGADTHDAIGRAVLPAPTAAGEDVAALGMAVIPPLVARGSDVVGDHGRAILPALAAYGEADPRGIVPDYAVSDAVLPAFAAYGYETPVVAHGEAILPALAAFGTDSTEAVGRAVLPAFQANGYAAPTDYLFGVWPRWQAVPPGIQITLDFPEFEIEASVYPAPSIRAVLGFPTIGIESQTGAQTALNFPAISVESTVSVRYPITVEPAFPAIGIEASVLPGGIAYAELAFPEIGIEASTGSRATLEMPAIGIEASVLPGGIAYAVLDFPDISIEASTGSVRSPITVELAFPEIGVVAGQLAIRATLEMPAIGVEATVIPGVAPGVAASAVYAVNLRTQAVTTLTLPPFERVLTAHGCLYGIAAGTLYRLDEAATPLPVQVRFAQQDFGDGLRKRSDKVYLRARSSAPITVEMIADEDHAYRYPTRPVADRHGLVMHRCSTGKGVAFHTAGLVLRNQPGQHFEIGGMEWRVVPLSRRIN